MKNMGLNPKKVTILGLGYVGLPLALLASSKGYEVVGIDLDQRKLDLIKAKKSPFVDEKIETQLQRYDLQVDSNISSMVGSSVVVVCVPTPVYENKLPDYRPVEGASRNISKYLEQGQLIILESTVNPGVCEEIVIPILEAGSGLKAGTDFFVAHCPERINPGDPKWDVSNIPRVVGGLDKESLKLAVNFYESIIDAKIKPMASLKEAESVKIVENSFRNVNIAFVNELAQSFGELGIDVVNVIEGAATKPFSFMSHFPGCGIGGHCIPVDPYYLIDYAQKKNGFKHSFLALACETNKNMPAYTVALAGKALERHGKLLKGSKIAVLGVSYKQNIGDWRESPSFEIIKELKEKDAIVNIFDPFVIDKSTHTTLESALLEVDAVILATSHDVYTSINPKIYIDNGIKIIIDGRNCLNKSIYIEAGMDYIGIGR